MSKFLDKTGLDALWAKIKSTFQTLSNLVTSWSSMPSDSKYPSEKLVKDSLDGKANTTLNNVTAKSLANLYSITDGYASHINQAAGYGLLATIDYSNHSGYSDTNAVFELYDKASNSVFTGKRYLVVNIRNNSSSRGASGSYVYKVTELIQTPVWSHLSLKVYRTDNTNIRIYSLGAGTSFYGSMVCKLVSCTDFSGESKYSKITMHKGAATNTVPSGTEVPISIITEDYETIPDTYRSIIQDISKGSNLIVNGSGTLGTNYNWPGYTFDGSECYHASAGSFTHDFCTGTWTHPNRYTTEYVQLDQTKTNEYSVDVKADVTTGGLHIRFTIHFYDIDKNNIKAETVMYGNGTTTTLAQDLNPGDTVVHLTSAANWNTSVSQTYQRGFIFWDYTNSYGYTYPVETYSRNVYSNWFNSASDVDTTNNTITLNKAWTGPKKLAGTSVSKCSSGETYVYLSAYNATPTSETGWKTLTGVITASTFRAGTAFVKFGWINDGYDSTSVSRIHFTNVRVSERAVTAAKLSTARKLAVSLSNTSTDTSFDGSADVTNIKTTGTLGLGNGGTGATTAKGASYNINAGMNSGDSDGIVNTSRFAFNYASPSASTGGLYYRTAPKVWDWIKGKISSVLGLTATSYGGNAATATTAAGYTSGGAIDNAMQGKVDKETGKGLSTNDYTTADKNKVASAVQTGDLGTAAYKDVPASGNASTTQVVMGSDSRLSDARPASDVSAWAKAATKPTYTASEVGALQAGPSSGDYAGQSAIAWCIKVTRLAVSDRGYAHITVDLSRSADGGDFGCVDIMLKADASDYYTVSYPHVRRSTDAKQLGQVLYANAGFMSVNGVLYLGVTCHGWSSQCSPRISSDMMNGQFTVEFGDYHASVQSSAAARTWFPVYANYNGSNMAAIGSDTIPVYIDQYGQVTPGKNRIQAVSALNTSTMDPEVLYVL